MRSSRLCQPEHIEVTGMMLEPRGQALILNRLRDRRRRVDAEDFSTDIRMLECAVQIRADHAGAPNAVDAAVVQPRERREAFDRIERGHAKMDLVAAEAGAARRGPGHLAPVLLATEARDRW